MSVNQKVFLDANLLIYAHTNVDIPKQEEIQRIIINDNTVISTQVFKEAANVLFKKIKFAWRDIRRVLQEMEPTEKYTTSTCPSPQNPSTILYRLYPNRIRMVRRASTVGRGILFTLSGTKNFTLSPLPPSSPR